MKNISPLKFARYLSYSEIQKNRNDVITGTDFSKLGVYSKYVTKSLNGKFLVSEGIFILVCYCEKSMWSDISCVCKGYWWKIFEQIVGLLLLLILKSSHQRHSVKIGALKNFANFTGKHPRTFKFLKKSLQHGCFPSEERYFQCFSSEISEILSKKVFVNPAPVSSQVILFTMHEKNAANEA